MSKNIHRYADRHGESFFRARGHVIIVPAGSGLAILDLDRGALFAGTPEAADALDALVRDRAKGDTMRGGAGSAVAWVADFLLAFRLIQPSGGSMPGRPSGAGASDSPCSAATK
jgi:hypothetical protein